MRRRLTRRAKHWQNGIIEKSLGRPARNNPLAGFFHFGAGADLASPEGSNLISHKTK